jgi:hypothetical protein
MTETALAGPSGASVNVNARRPANSRRLMTTAHWYAILGIAIAAGWQLKSHQLINPEQGLGYWLGIIGGSMMLALLLYPLRKRYRIMRYLGPTKAWFRMHMILGLLGPLLILYHCNFSLGSLNSRVALYSMLLVAGSGLIGRYLYARIHRGLYGKRTSLSELRHEVSASIEQSRGLATLMPEFTAKLDSLSSSLAGDKITRSVGIRRSLRWAFSYRFVQLSLWFTARRELNAAAAKSPAIRANHKRLRKTTTSFIGNYTSLLRRVAQFSFYERLFSLWHILHLPIFLLMIFSALAHVLAVHMY